MRLRSFAIILLLLCLTACNAPQVPTVTPTPEASATPLPPTATATSVPTATETPLPAYVDVNGYELYGVTVLLRHFLVGDAREKLIELTERFNAENDYGITVTADNSVTEEDFLSSSQLSELIIADADDLNIWREKGLSVLDLSVFMDDSVIGLAATGADPIMENILGDDNAFAPLWTEPYLLFYNRTWAQNLGFSETPESLAAFAEQACAAGQANYQVKDEGMHGTGGWIVSDDAGAAVSWLLNYGSFDGDIKSLFAQEEEGAFVQTSQWLRNLYDNGCIWNSRLPEPYDYFAGRYALFYSGTYADAERQLIAFTNSAHPDDNWDLLPYPRRSSDGKLADPRIFGNTVVGAIPETDRLTQYAAWVFLNWLYSEGGAAELALAAGAWPVQDSDYAEQIYRTSGKDKLFLSLAQRKYLVPVQTDADWKTERSILADGFDFVFNIASKAENIPLIWQQVNETIEELRSMKE